MQRSGVPLPDPAAPRFTRAPPALGGRSKATPLASVRSRLPPRRAASAPTHPVPDLGREPVGRALVELRGAHGGTDGPGAGRADLETGCGRTVRDRADAAPAAHWLAEQMSL